MLDTFAPTNASWDIDLVDESQHPRNRLINICARSGNRKAVLLLIKHGADISEGVLHELVRESVINPNKIDKLVEVYQAIVDNAVTWRCLEEHTDFLKNPGSEKYMELSRKTTIWLLTNPLKEYGNMGVLQYALAHGALQMLWMIINTKSVFRAHGEEICKWIGQSYDNMTTWAAYDVTNFTEVTTPPDGVSTDAQATPPSETEGGTQEDTETNGAGSSIMPSIPSTQVVTHDDNSDDSDNDNESDAPTEAAVLFSPDGPRGSSNQLSSIGVRQDEDVQRTPDANNAQNGHRPQRNFDTPSPPKMPYLTYLLTVFRHWTSSDILSIQPLKGLTQPYIKFIQLCYLIMGMLQLSFMISFTMLRMPTTCSLASMFNISAASCSSSLSNISDDRSTSNVNQQRSLLALIWSIWPTVLIAGEVHATVHSIYEAYLAHREANKQFRRVVQTKDLHSSFLRKLCEILLSTLSLKLFCLVMYIWIYKYIWSESYASYVEVTAMVLLFGWITNLAFFGAMSKNFSVFILVIQKIVVKDIPIFMLIFGFTVVGFSFAMHTLLLSACLSDETIAFDSTLFSVLSSAFGIGEFFEATVTNSKCAGAGTMYTFEFVYFLYVCATMIILLNILIAMMNNRYEKAKRRAKNIWMFNMLSTLRRFESYRCFVYLMKTWDVKVCGMPGSANADKNRKEEKHIPDRLLVFNKKSNRYYLLIEVPVDKNAVRGHLSLR